MQGVYKLNGPESHWRSHDQHKYTKCSRICITSPVTSEAGKNWDWEREEFIILMASVNCLCLLAIMSALTPELFFLCPGYSQNRSNLPKSSKIDERESITLHTNDIQSYDPEYNWSLNTTYNFFKSFFFILVSLI